MYVVTRVLPSTSSKFVVTTVSPAVQSISKDSVCTVRNGSSISTKVPPTAMSRPPFPCQAYRQFPPGLKSMAHKDMGRSTDDSH